jgi:hypothetical protein
VAKGLRWSADPSASHDRLVFLAARDGMAARSRRWWHTAIRVLGGAQSSLPSAADSAPRVRPEQELQSRSLHIGVIVTDRLAARFNDVERERLRLHGELPSWFWPAYDDGVREERRRR